MSFVDPGGLLVFAALARARGVRGAAAALGVPRSTVSRRLADLERRLGAQLVIRTNRRFELTELGASLVAHAERLEELLHDTDELALRAVGEPAGVLRVDAAPVLGEEILPEVVAALVEQHPRLEVRVRMSPDYADLRRGAVDVALRAWPLEDASDLFAVRLGTSVTGCYASPAYVAAHGAPRAPRDLEAHSCLVVGSASPALWSFRGARPAAVSGRVRVDSFRLARSLALRGVGVLRAARIFVEPLVRSGELVPLLEKYWPETPVHAVHAGPNPPAPKVRVFVELCKRAVMHAL